MFFQKLHISTSHNNISFPKIKRTAFVALVVSSSKYVAFESVDSVVDAQNNFGAF